MSDTQTPQRPPLAVVGISALFPGSSDVRGFWQDILQGRDLITEVPPHYWLTEDYYDPDPRAPDKTYGRRGAFLDKVDFDPMEFGVPPSTLSSIDTCQLLALIVARRVLDDATRGQFAKMDTSRVSVILGAAAGMELLGEMASRLQRPVWLKALRDHGVPEPDAQAVCQRISDQYVPWTEATFPGLLGNVITGRIANRFNLGGTNCTTDAACASSLSALSMATSELYLGSSDLVITGGVDTTNNPFLYMCFSKTPALSHTGDCRPFSEAADGTMLGEGLGMLALKRLADAERDGDRVYAVIKGVGTSSDGRAKSIYAPRAQGQAVALRRAYEVAGYSPDTVELVEAHGTGTLAGDIEEFRGLSMVFDEAEHAPRQWCALGSVKSQIGHTKGAAGVAGLIKATLALHHKVLPPTIKVERPDPAMKIEQSPFYLNSVARPWVRNGSHPRRAGVSSFGFGGTNFHVTLEEYRGPADAARTLRAAPVDLVLLGAADAQGLLRQCSELPQGQTDEGALRRLARASQLDFDPTKAARLAVVASDTEDLLGKLARAAELIQARPEVPISLAAGIHYGLGPAPDGELAFLFPGQGSQYLNMGADLALHFDAARAAWDRTAGVDLGPEALHRVVFPPPAFDEQQVELQTQQLTATQWAQPALGAASLATLELMRQLDLQPACVGGHSFGEVTALCAAGVLDPDQMLRVARRRGELMAAAAEVPGAMLAVAGTPADELQALLDQWGSQVVIANYNSPQQVALSGRADDVEQVERQLKEQGITARRLPVATAFHSPVVSASAEPFQQFLEQVELGQATLPVYANSEAAPYPADAAEVRQLLAHQIARPVRFAEQVQAMYDAGVRVFVEVGPGSVLTGLVGQCLHQQAHLAVSTDRKGQGLRGLYNALGRLCAAGLALDFAPLWAGVRQEIDPATLPRPKLTVPIDGVNHGKRYPPPGGVEALPKPNPSRPQASNFGDGSMNDGSDKERTTAPAVAKDAERTAEVPASPEPALPAGDGDSVAWIQAYRELQQQTAQAHAAYQQTMADSHLAFLRAAEQSAQGLQAMVTGEPLAAMETPVDASQDAPQPIQRPPMVEIPLVDVWTPAAPPAPPAPAEPTEVVQPAGGAVLSRVPTEHDQLGTQAQPVTAAEPQLPATQEAPAVEPQEQHVTEEHQEHPEVDYRELMLEVVADKTGYPVEILELEMELEADLGIDSIKRVEILSALQDRAPWLPEVDASVVPKLQTLGQVLEMLEAFERGEVGGEVEQVDQDVDVDDHVDVDVDVDVDDHDHGLVEHEHEHVDDHDHVDEDVDVDVDEVVEELEEVAAEGDEGAAIGRYALREVLAAASGQSMLSHVTGGPLVVTDEGTGVARVLVGKLRQRGLNVDLVSEVPARAGGVIFLGGLREVSDPAQAAEINREAFLAAKAVAPRFGQSGGLLVTVQDTGGDFGLSGTAGQRAWLGGLAALARTACREWERAAVKAIDIERDGRPAKEMAEALMDELLAGGPELEVGLHSDGTRITLQHQPAQLQPGEPVLNEESVLVVTGGGRGVTADTLLELAQRFRPRLLILGRTALREEPPAYRDATDDAQLKRIMLEEAQAERRSITPAELRQRSTQILANREVRANLAALRDAGSEVEYHSVDVRDTESVETILDLIRQEWGAVTGLLHGAGVLADKMIADKTPEQFDRVFNTKVLALQNLLAATDKDPLSLICLFSSVAARQGNVGQCDYAMANEVLNQVAGAEATRRDGTCLVRSINWGPWDGGMVTPSLADRFKEAGVPLIPIKVGARMLANELQGDLAGPVDLLIGGIPPA